MFQHFCGYITMSHHIRAIVRQGKTDAVQGTVPEPDAVLPAPESATAAETAEKTDGGDPVPEPETGEESDGKTPDENESEPPKIKTDTE